MMYDPFLLHFYYISACIMSAITDDAAMRAALKAVTDKLNSVKTELAHLEKTKANQTAPPKAKDGEDDALDAELATMGAELEILKKSVPEGRLRIIIFYSECVITTCFISC